MPVLLRWPPPPSSLRVIDLSRALCLAYKLPGAFANTRLCRCSPHRCHRCCAAGGAGLELKRTGPDGELSEEDAKELQSVMAELFEAQELEWRCRLDPREQAGRLFHRSSSGSTRRPYGRRVAPLEPPFPSTGNGVLAKGT